MTPDPFEACFNPGRILFGAGSSARAAEEIARLGCQRALVLSTPLQRSDAEALAARLGDAAAGVFAEAAMHTPVEVTARAIRAFHELEADCVIAFGGGSTIGLGKAIAHRTDCPQLVIATTYAGSEVTPILGETENGIKTTLRAASVLPETVIYDPELTHGLPVAMSVTSGLNAIAHAIEGYMPVTAIRSPRCKRSRGYARCRWPCPGSCKTQGMPRQGGGALYGSWLCGTVLGTVGMSLHHKLCHTLGGSFDLPHAETHAILIAHTAAFNAPFAEAALAPAAALFGGEIGPGLWDFARNLSAPLALRDLGLSQAQLDRAADLAVQNPYWNPRPVERAGVRALLQDAWSGDRPKAGGSR